ncbi:MAG: mechanosensitive ion channel family protein [Lachnospiraceae bacterium]|nr:mechanosensitive ion channel family protein [Lachnospiraceae bacterium]
MKNKEHVEKKTSKKSTARVIGIIVILLILVFLNAPKLLFFLSPSQQEAIKLFHETYFGKYLPVQSKDGGFDYLRILSLLFMIAACWAVYRVLMWIISKIRTKNRHAETIKGMIANLLRYAIVIFAIIYGLNLLGADILTVIASLGVLALIIGFGAQSLIEDIFAGIFILFEGRFYVGDIISVDGFRGQVKSIGIVSTQIVDTGGNNRIINNSDIRVLTNLSEVTSLAVSIVGISYNADLLAAEEVIKDLLQELPGRYPKYFPKTPQYMGVEDLSSSSVDLKVVADVDEANIYQARRILNRELKLALDAGGIEIPFPQVVVWQGKEKLQEQASAPEELQEKAPAPEGQEPVKDIE